MATREDQRQREIERRITALIKKAEAVKARFDQVARERRALDKELDRLRYELESLVQGQLIFEAAA